VVGDTLREQLRAVLRLVIGDGINRSYLKIVALLVPKQVELDGVAQPFAVIPAEFTSAEAWEKV
jgi:hypothetical protein